MVLSGVENVLVVLKRVLSGVELVLSCVVIWTDGVVLLGIGVVRCCGVENGDV